MNSHKIPCMANEQFEFYPESNGATWRVFKEFVVLQEDHSGSPG